MGRGHYDNILISITNYGGLDKNFSKKTCFGKFYKLGLPSGGKEEYTKESIRARPRGAAITNSKFYMCGKDFD